MGRHLNDYGFVSQFSIDAEKAKDRIKFLYYDSGIQDFQFYDCMERYESPIDPNKSEWKDPLGRRIFRETIQAYLDQIMKLEAKSWFYIPIYSLSPNSEKYGDDQLFTKIEKTSGEKIFVAEWLFGGLLSLIDPGSLRWKFHFTDALKEVLKMGFYGIHFDQYGSFEREPNRNLDEAAVTPYAYRYNYRCEPYTDPENFKYIHKPSSIADFLSYFRQECPQAGITFNAVDGYGLGETRKYCDFPYLEVWSEENLQEYSQYLQNSEKFVITMYTGLRNDSFDWERFHQRRKIVNAHGGSFLYKGDSNAYLINGYFPDAIQVCN